MARDDLFSQLPPAAADAPPSPEAQKHQPLAARMRPGDLSEFVGQSHILAPGQLLRRAIEADRIHSLIFYGPPGTGKTSLAQIIARRTKSKFERLSGVESNVADMRRVLATAANRLENKGQSTILFIDEIHRFNKAQQDVLLPDVESGVVRLIGATTHNPFFFVNSPLVSRSQIFELRPLSEDDLFALLTRALKDPDRGLGYMKIEAADDALRHLAKLSDGDARKALNSLEIAALTTAPSPEDVGLADPMALVLANAAFQAAEFIGWPEARIPLAEAALYIATANKSNSTILAIDSALDDVKSGRTLPVPEHLRDAHYQGAKRLGHGQGYKYAHDFPEHFVAQDYLGAEKRYYEPSEQGVEKKIKERLDKWRQLAKANQEAEKHDPK